MCLIIFAINTHPDYPLIIAANRDEFYNRKTQQAHEWNDPKGLLAGKDVRGGGTWLGVHPNHGLAMLTNYRDPSQFKKDAPTRGKLVTDFFTDGLSPWDYLTNLSGKSGNYNGFNLLCADKTGMFYYGNYAKEVERLKSGIHGLSNGLINEPWPKVILGKAKMEKLINERVGEPEAYLLMLKDSEKAADDDLPSTGVDTDLERTLSPMFISSPEYGSRSSTVILGDQNGVVRFIERTYDQQTDAFDDREFIFSWDIDYL